MDSALLNLRFRPADGTSKHPRTGVGLDAGAGHDGVETGLAKRVVAGQNLG